MMIMAKRSARLLGRLANDTSGVAFIEFALSLPIMTALIAGGLEAANLAVVHLRCSQIATMVADNTARVRDRIDESDVNNIMLGAKLSGDGIKVLERARITVATVEDNASTPTDTTDQIVTWQRCKGKLNPGATLLTQGQVVTGGVGRGVNKIAPTPGNPVIFVEIYYDYTPLIPGMSAQLLGADNVVRYTSAFSVRDRRVQTLQNGGNLSGAQVASCSLFNDTF